MNKYPKRLTREEGLELRKMRKDAGIPTPKIAKYMHTYPSKISDLERGKKGVDSEHLNKQDKR